MRQVYDWESVRRRLGIDSDPEIARDLGCTRAAVQLKRKQLGIVSRRDRVWSVFDWGVVDWGYSDSTIRTRYPGVGGPKLIAQKRLEIGRPHLRVHPSVRRGTYSFDYERFRSLVGTMSDRDLSGVIGLSVQRIGQLRTMLGIGVYGGRVTRRIAWSFWVNLIRGWDGTQRDLARKIGCCVQSLANYRKKLGLGRCPRGRR